jgi:hypothetical protein
MGIINRLPRFNETVDRKHQPRDFQKDQSPYTPGISQRPRKQISLLGNVQPSLFRPPCPHGEKFPITKLRKLIQERHAVIQTKVKNQKHICKKEVANVIVHMSERR